VLIHGSGVLFAGSAICGDEHSHPEYLTILTCIILNNTVSMLAGSATRGDDARQ
jgi:hypothetical protein